MPRPTMPAPTDDDRAGARDVFASESDRAAASRFGVGLFLITLSMLFGAVMLLLIALRWDGAFRLEDMPPLPWQVWLSTGLLIIESGLLVRCTRQTTAQGARSMLLAALLVALAFLATQTWAWCTWQGAGSADPGQMLMTTGFHVATGVHAAHVLGGLVPLALLAWWASSGTWDARRRNQVRLTGWYWHFLNVVWVLLILTLILMR